MITCPNCHAENRSGAKFCKSCATRLPESSAETYRLPDADRQPAANSLHPVSRQPAPPSIPVKPAKRPMTKSSRSGTRPISAPKAFLRRPPGAIFGDIFLYENVLFSDAQQHRYSVRQLDVSEDLQIRACPNPECGALFPPRSVAPEKYCTDCGTVLEKGGKDLVLIEAHAPIPDTLARTAGKGLSHGSVRAPLSAFVERLADQPRHCVVVSRVMALETTPEPLTAVRWGILLGRGLDYLHDNGVSFGGKVDASCVGLVNGKTVWANFTTCKHLPEGYVTDRSADTHSLAQMIFTWLTGKPKIAPDPSLTPALQQVFLDQAADGQLSNGLKLAEALEKAVSEMAAPTAIDFQVGRCSNVGKVRSLNEDSILVLEVNRVVKSVSRPLGVFVVADGMGGHTAGEIASSAIVSSIAQSALKEWLLEGVTRIAPLNGQTWLTHAVQAANAEVYNLRKTSGSDMGSTLVAAVMDAGKLTVSHIGDSRAYRINAESITRLTIDHSLVERLVSTGQITRQEARYHPQRNVIYRTVGDKQQVEIETTTHTFLPGDSLLLCSDGLTGPLDDDTIARLVRQATSPQDACNHLIEAANAGGGEDNISVIIVQLFGSC
jgi:protein phosphatase